MIESLDDSTLKSEIEQQAQALREIEEIKKRKEMEEADAEFARKLMQEEEEKSQCRIITSEQTVNTHRKPTVTSSSRQWEDHEIYQISTPPRYVILIGIQLFSLLIIMKGKSDAFDSFLCYVCCFEGLLSFSVDFVLKSDACMSTFP